MKQRLLGDTGLSVSELGLGTAQLAGPSIIAGKPSGFKPMTKKESLDILHCAFEKGINFVDTGNIYGNGRAEEVIGEVLKEKSYDVIVATKCGLTNDGTRNFSPDYIISCLEGSMRRLQTDCIDVFQLTKPGKDVIEEGKIFGLFDKLKSDEKIRFSGVSVGTVEEGFALIRKVDTLQIMYNLLDRSAEGLIEKAAKSGMGIIVRSPLSTGLLTGKFTVDTKFEDYDYRKSFLPPEELKKRLGIIDKIMSDHGITKDRLTETAFKFVLENKNVSTVIAGTSRIDQLIQNINIVNKLH